MQEVKISENVIVKTLEPRNAFSAGKGEQQKVKVFYISDIHLMHHLKEYINLNNEQKIKIKIKKIVINLFDKGLTKQIERNEETWNDEFIILFGGDTSSSKKINILFYKEFRLRYLYVLYRYWHKVKEWKKGIAFFEKPENFPIYVILGNHELNDFSTVEKAVKFYNSFFKHLRFHFLHNNICKIYGYSILGGIGFAAYNNLYNSEKICTTTPPMSRKQEISESKKFRCFYLKNAKKCLKKSELLIVLAHYPVKDWLGEEECDSNCVYFTGHTHRNHITYTENIHIYADNQIGYEKKKIAFKECYLGLCYNPFLNYSDGYHEITLEQYVSFSKYICDPISGISMLHKQLSKNDSKLYIVKHDGFSGFFIIRNGYETKLCIGGRVKKISSVTDIEYFNGNLKKVVEKYYLMLKPYRAVQEKISNIIKKIGFSGQIHGFIIDIDMYRHIMLNPLDGKITYYYSPVFGYIQEFSSLNELLEISGDFITCKEYSLGLKEKEQVYDNKEIVLIGKEKEIYRNSNKMNQLQRLFTTGVLREWNEELISDSKEKYIGKLETDKNKESDIKYLKNEEGNDYCVIRKNIRPKRLYEIIKELIKSNYNKINVQIMFLCIIHNPQNIRFDKEIQVECSSMDIIEMLENIFYDRYSYNFEIKIFYEIKKAMFLRMELETNKIILKEEGKYKFENGCLLRK